MSSIDLECRIAGRLAVAQNPTRTIEVSAEIPHKVAPQHKRDHQVSQIMRLECQRQSHKGFSGRRAVDRTAKIKAMTSWPSTLTLCPNSNLSLILATVLQLAAL